MSPALLMCLVIPIICTAILFGVLFFVQKHKVKTKPHYNSWMNTFCHRTVLVKSAMSLVGGIIMTVGIYQIGSMSQTIDYEIFNGQVTSKDRHHDEYVESYQCNCVPVSDGDGGTTIACLTFYRDHFTVTWTCRTNIGDIRIKHLDELSRSVYNEPDPARYTQIQIADPVSLSFSYTNWIKAVPDSLFKPLQQHQVDRFAGKIPEYPGRIYDYYKIDRVLGVGVTVPNVREWNHKLSMSLRTLGPTKQANVVLLFTNEVDSLYAEAIRDAWVNGKKNDIIVLVGVNESFDNPPNWVKVLALSNHNIFQVNLRERLSQLSSLDSTAVIDIIHDETMKTFSRKPMSDFDYLKNEVTPSIGLVIMMGILIAFLNIGIFFINLD